MIHHIEIYVTDLSKTKKFYSNFFSLIDYTIYQEWDKGVSFKQNDSYIVFVQVEEQYKSNGYHRKNTGLNHIAYSVENNNIIDNIRKIMKRSGVIELYGDKYPFAGGKDHYAFFFEDPDRIKLEVVAQNII